MKLPLPSPSFPTDPISSIFQLNVSNWKKKAEEKERMNIVDEIHHPFRKINGEQHDFSDPKQFENKDLVILEMQLFH